jgi:anti-sigma B factor antagonist
MSEVPEPFSAELIHLDGSAVLAIRGEVDMATAPAFHSVIEQTMQLGVPVVVDLAAVTFMDSSGLSVLAVASQDDVPISVRSPSLPVGRLLAMTGLDELICDRSAVSRDA